MTTFTATARAGVDGAFGVFGATSAGEVEVPRMPPVEAGFTIASAWPDRGRADRFHSALVVRHAAAASDRWSLPTPP